MAICLCAGAAYSQSPGTPKTSYKFSFGPKPAKGFTQVSPAAVYGAASEYGFDLGSKVTALDRGVTGQNGKPFFFSARLPAGAYRVTVTLGDTKGAAITTVKSETRRLMLEAIPTAAGKFVTRTFLVHLRRPQLPDGTTVALKPRERDPILYVQWDENTRIPFLELDWDEKLTLEFSGEHPSLSSVEIAAADQPVTVYLIGDSTVTDQMMEPWGAWGQMLPRWFAPPVLIANYAESGETTASFIGERRWPKLLSEIHAGDFVLMQFGINDRSLPLDRFRQYFVQFIQDTRAHGATPVLVTSQNLRRLDAGGKAVPTLGGYPDAMRDVARQQNAALIDLNGMSATLYEALGPEKLAKAFVDGTHQNSYGAYELAKCVVAGIVQAELGFASHISAEWKGFDPAHPDPIESFRLPPDPQLDPARPGARQLTSFKFDFTSAIPAYSAQTGYGFEAGYLPGDNRPFYFSVDLPEGNYRVTVKFGDAAAESDNTVFAELRRLMIERVRTEPGKFETRSFLVNVRRPVIAGGAQVRVTDREKNMEAWAWDNRLTLEFNGAHPAVASLAIEKADVPTLFLIGDSTVCDQPREPFNSWGQMITRFLKPSIAVSNQAESGESVAGALAKGRLDKIWADMKSGDYLFVQFGHNDMKSTAPDALERYTADLRRVVDETRKRGGVPVLFTPVSRRSFNPEGKITNSFRGYPDAVKLVAREKDVPLIDLQEMGAAFYEAMGPEPSHQAFANAGENTHHSDYGSYQVAKCVLQRMKDIKLPLAALIVDDFPGFDPAHPDRFEDFRIPRSPLVTNIAPLGN